MTRKDYLDELDRELGFLSLGERQEIVREFGTHIDEAMDHQSGLSEDELMERLPSPAVFAAEFRSEMPAGTGSRPGTDERGRPGHDDPSARFKRFFRYAGGEPKELYRQFDGIQRVEIRSIAADVQVTPGSGFSCRISGNWDDDAAPQLELSGSMLRMDLGSAVDKAELVLPDDLAEFLVRTISGDVHGHLCADASAVVHSASGDINLVVQNGAINLRSSSGDIHIEGRIGSAEVKTASGKVHLTGLHGTLKANSASGDIHLVYAGAEGDSAVSTTSGDVRIELPPEASPGLRAYSVSGEVVVQAVRVDRKPGRKSCTRDGGPGTLKVSTLSGDIRIS